jgi:hypothetical protein
MRFGHFSEAESGEIAEVTGRQRGAVPINPDTGGSNADLQRSGGQIVRSSAV